jgi:diaminopimelate epimerase
MTRHQLTKHHGLGNDFLVCLDGAAIESRGAELAQRWCDRHRGVGADGLLLVLPATHDSHDVRMRLHNADGSIAEMSGNGIRCFAQALVDGGVVRPGPIRILTDGGLRTVQATESDGEGIAQVTVDMGQAAVGTHPVLGEGGTTVDLGNPHLVLAVDSLDDIDISVVGPERERPYLSGPTHGINVEVIRAADPATIDMVVWERGVGVTQACGTGATASAVAAHRLGLVGRRVTVRQPGGDAVVDIEDDRVILTGPSQHICKVEVTA